jgi:outer membrane lipoprotein LolB
MSFRDDNDAWSASLYWQEEPDHYQIQIVAPLGQGGVEITGDGDTVSLSTNDGQTYQEEEVELIMLQNLGWRVPASAMRYWVKGIPEPGSDIDDVEIDELGRPVNMKQSGWTISYQSYTRVKTYQLPVRINLQRDDASIRMIINYWNLSP